MKHRKFLQRFVELVAELTYAQSQKLIAALQQRGEGDEVQRQLEQRVEDNPRCPHCQSRRIEGWGRERNGLKRSRCRDCQRTFNPLTGTALAGLRKKDRWLSFAAALNESLRVRKAAKRCHRARSSRNGGRLRRNPHEGFAPQKYGIRLPRFMALRRHAGAHPFRTLFKMPRASRTGSQPHSRHRR
jgi:transposase-like protein